MTYSPEIIHFTREYFAGVARRCVETVVSGAAKVDSIPNYVRWGNELVRSYLAGERDDTFAFRHMADSLQRKRTDTAIMDLKP